jgi:maltose O-acetyltransferase
MTKSELQKMQSGEWFNLADPEINELKSRGVQLCQEFNELPETAVEERSAKLKELFGATGEYVNVNGRLSVDYGVNIHVGEHFYANYNFTVLDNAKVIIGKNAMIGPDVGIYTINHPLKIKDRLKPLGIAKPVTIGDNVWIGGHATICPGATIGNGVVVAAGAVVTKDVPDNVVVAGVPAKVIKKIEQ